MRQYIDAFRKSPTVGMTALAASMLLVTACADSAPKNYSYDDLGIESDPIARSNLIVKVMGSTAREDTHAFMKFHVYGYAGDGNLVPFFTMNNYIVQKWTPVKDGYYDMQHYEVAYYSEFDTDKPIEDWKNPITGEINAIPPFILGPISREYTPDGVIAPGLAPQPMNISVVGGKVYIPTQSTDMIPNRIPKEMGQYYSGPTVFWDSMLTYSADMADVLDADKKRAPAEIHMQNLVSWAPYFEMGQRPGRTMVRAFGGHISGPEALSPTIRANLQKYTPEIFNTDQWTDLRIDTIDFVQETQAKIASGDIIVKQ